VTTGKLLLVELCAKLLAASTIKMKTVTGKTSNRRISCEILIKQPLFLKAKSNKAGYNIQPKARTLRLSSGARASKLDATVTLHILLAMCDNSVKGHCAFGLPAN
jgi:hypothetical protein